MAVQRGYLTSLRGLAANQQAIRYAWFVLIGCCQPCLSPRDKTDFQTFTCGHPLSCTCYNCVV